MIEAQIYKGIEFIQLADLPTDQQVSIREWASNDQIIKILKNDSLLTDCVQYKDYKYWFENVLQSETVTLTQKSPRKASSIRLAIGR